jgi:uncharacterized membrane protein
MLKYAITYLGTGLAFAAIDAVYLTLMGGRLYRPLLDYALADTVNLPAAVAFYLIYIAGVLALVILPNREASLGKAALAGATLGAVAYGAYDLTNQATLKVWATHISVIDIAWGAVLTAAAASLGLIVWRWTARAFA